MRDMHVGGVRCVLCLNPGSLHHVLPRGQGGDDVASNLVGLCGSGTTGEHGLLEAGDVGTRLRLGQYLKRSRPDTLLYLQGKLGEEGAKEWLHRRLMLDI